MRLYSLIFRSTVGLLLALSFVPSSAARAEVPPGARDSLTLYLDGLAAFGFAGQIVVAEGDSVIAELASGVADRGGRRIGPDTRFALGSITKSVTAALVVHLAEQGKLSLDDTLARWLVGVPNEKRRITLRMLLTHTSGLPLDADAVDEDDSRDQVVAKTLAEPLRAVPGERFLYSNAGYQLLAAVLEQATGRTYVELAHDAMLLPSGMRSSGTGARFAASVRDVAMARNEWTMNGSLRDWRQKWAGSGAGDLVSTALDLHRWARTLQGAGPLSIGALDTMMVRRQPLARALFYGFGLYLVPEADAPDRVSIGGDVPGYHAAAWFMRRAPRRITAVVMSGERYGRSLPVTAIQRTLWRLLEGVPVMLPPATVSWPHERLEALAGAWEVGEGGTLVLERDADALRMLLAGPDAMALVSGSDSLGTRAALDARAERLWRAASAPTDSALRGELHEVEQKFWLEPLRRAMAERIRRYGALEAVTPEGTIALPWLTNGSRTYARLRFVRGETRASLAWLENGLLDVAFDEERPAPILLPLAPSAEGGLVAWDLLDGRTVRLEPFMDAKGPGLRVSGQGLQAIARRVRVGEPKR